MTSGSVVLAAAGGCPRSRSTDRLRTPPLASSWHGLSIAELEVIAAKGWRAPEEERLGGWLLRAAQGFTGRANSALEHGRGASKALPRVLARR